MDVGSNVGSEVGSRKRTLFLLPALAVALLASCAKSNSRQVSNFNKTTAQCQSSAVENQYVVRWKDGTTVVYKGKTEDQLLDDVLIPNESEIEIAEQDQKIRLAPQPVSSVSEQAVVAETNDWGQQIIEASAAWNQNVTGAGVIVAVIDSGLQRTHPQIRNQLAINAGEVGTDAQGRDKSTNGIDDDGNGYIDDVSGYDFAEDSGAVTDGTGHGTHVSGIIAADATSGSIKGVAPGAKILPLDFMTDDGSGNISDAIRAMSYAASRGAKVINASWGGAPCSATLQKAINDVGAQGVLFVSASGNDGVDLDTSPEYPASFGLPTQITVGASTNKDYMAVFSNYSYSVVNIMAPGANIWSTFPGSSTEKLSGTSMASPFVAGAAALLFSVKPNASPSAVKSALLASVDAGPFAVSTRGRLNIRKALIEIQKQP